MERSGERIVTPADVMMGVYPVLRLDVVTLVETDCAPVSIHSTDRLTSILETGMLHVTRGGIHSVTWIVTQTAEISNLPEGREDVIQR